MTTVEAVYRALDEWAPFATQMGFDNAGLLVGRVGRQVTRILVALDITREVAEEAGEMGAELIVSHHPLIFTPLKAVSDGSVTGEVVLTLAERGIAAICAHTNLDAAQGGVNDCLAQVLGLTGLEQLHPDGEDAWGRTYGIGRVGRLEKGCDAVEFAQRVKQALGAASVRLVDAGRRVEKVAVGGGSCGSMLSDALAAGCDTFVTADVKYDVFLAAAAQGLNLLDAGHYATEQVVCPAIVQRLQECFPEVEVRLSRRHREVYAGV